MLVQLNRTVNKIVRYCFKKPQRLIVQKSPLQKLRIRLQLQHYKKAGPQERASYWEEQFSAEDLAGRFVKAGISLKPKRIDIDDFECWLNTNQALAEHYEKMGDVSIEKLLEHYLSMKFLSIADSDTVIDVGAAKSPFAAVLRQKGIRAYRQDLVFPAGINGWDIGGNAGSLPVDDGFADVLTLHCAYECFQGDADIHFAMEAGRVLRKGGRVGIVPLYIDTIHFVKTSPWCDRKSILAEPEAKKIWRDDNYRAPFSRHYSPESFTERILSRMSGLATHILFFTNIHELAAYYTGQRLYCHFMFRGEKA